ncbi:MAG: hypothetical protein QM811_07520 [Pirellulales bacterium]
MERVAVDFRRADRLEPDEPVQQIDGLEQLDEPDHLIGRGRVGAVLVSRSPPVTT